MNLMPEFFILLLSIAAVVKGADILGTAAVEIANRLNVSKIVIGATLVAVATTLPEAVVSFISGAQNEGGIAVGTVIGSPAVNLALVLGVLFLFSKPQIEKNYYTRAIYIFIFLLAVVFALSLGGSIGLIGGLLLVFLAAVYLSLEFILSKGEEHFIDQVEDRFSSIKNYFSSDHSLKIGFDFFLGVLLLVFGGKFLVDSAESLAALLGVPNIVIAVSVIAFGTSLPELATAINSIIRKRISLSVGNLAGASVLNLSMALGLGTIINPVTIPKVVLFVSAPVLFIISLLGLVVVHERFPGKPVAATLILIYLSYIIGFILFEICLECV